MYTKLRNQKSEIRSQNLAMKILLSTFFVLLSITTNAQCAMCRAALDNDANVEQAKAVNDGIVYLMVIPYLLVALIGFLVYRMRKTKSKAD